MPEYVLKEVLKQGFTKRKFVSFSLFLLMFVQLLLFKVKAGPWLSWVET